MAELLASSAFDFAVSVTLIYDEATLSVTAIRVANSTEVPASFDVGPRTWSLAAGRTVEISIPKPQRPALVAQEDGFTLALPTRFQAGR